MWRRKGKKKKSCKAKQDSGKMKQEKCVSATEKEINLFLIGFTFLGLGSAFFL